jgi:hypothetical protein
LINYTTNHSGFGTHKSTNWKTSEQKESFNHIIGLPTKEGLEKPIFDYQELLYKALLSPGFCNPLNHDFKDKHLWIKKATGLGVTEFFLRFMAWLCLNNNDYRNSRCA